MSARPRGWAFVELPETIENTVQNFVDSLPRDWLTDNHGGLFPGHYDHHVTFLTGLHESANVIDTLRTLLSKEPAIVAHIGSPFSSKVARIKKDTYAVGLSIESTELRILREKNIFA